jgi:hypothetical protein
MREALCRTDVQTQHAVDDGNETTIHKCGLSAGVFVAPALAFAFTFLLAVLLKFHRPLGVTQDDVWMALLLVLAADTILFVIRFVAYDTGEIRLINRRLQAKLGPWNEVELDINAIDSVELYESALGDDGTIIVIPKSGSPLVLSHVPSPELLYNHILDQQEKAQSRKTPLAGPRNPSRHGTQDSYGFAA